MKPYRFPQDVKQSVFQVKDLLGVDFTTHESEVNSRRSPDAVNVISGYQGSVDKRFGTKIYRTFSDPIKTMLAISYPFNQYNDPSTPSSGYISIVQKTILALTYVGDSIDIYLGNIKLKKLTGTTGSYSLTTFTQDYEYSDKEIRKPKIMRLNDLNYLVLGIPKAYLIHLCFNNVGHTMWDAFINGTLPELAYGYIVDFQANPELQYAHFYTPSTSIARKPDGTSSTTFEGRNLLSEWVRNLFLADGTSTIYKCDGYFSSTSDVKVEKLIGGTWTLQTTGYTVANVGSYGQVTFTTAPAAPSTLGEDNVRISYRLGGLNACNWLVNYEYYGYGGRNDYAFVAMVGKRGEMKRNRDFRIRLEDWYMDTNSYTDFGDDLGVIKGYSLYGGYLVTHTLKIGENPTIFLRRGSLDDQGEAIFPVTIGLVGVGALNGMTNASLRGDPLWLSESGVVALASNEITNVQSIQDRGYYINQLLLKEPYLDQSIAFVYQNKYHLCVNGNMYIADPRMKYTEKLSFNESFQYDWYYFNGINATEYTIQDDTLYLADGVNIIRFKTAEDSYPYCDEIVYSAPTTWATATSYTINAIVTNGTDTYRCLVAHNSSNQPLEEGKYWHRIFNDTTVYQIPVICYWTTPIMNMGDITMRKTLQNLWVRLGKYARMSARIYYSTQGIISEKYDGIFDFSNIDFSRFTFSTDTDPSVLVTNRAERKFMSIQFKVESRDEYPFSLLEIVGKYVFNNQFKG